MPLRTECRHPVFAPSALRALLPGAIACHWQGNGNATGVDQVKTIRQYRTRERGFSDLLLYFGLVADGVVQLYDGCLMAAWSYRGPDLQAATNAEMSSIVARLNNVLKLGSGWMIHVDCMRSSAPGYPEGGAFPSITTRVIDDERRQQFMQERAHFESDYVLTLTYRVPTEREEKFKGWLYEGGERQARDPARRMLEFFIDSCARFGDVLGTVVRARRLATITRTDDYGSEVKYCELCRHVRRTITGEDFPFVLPDLPVYLNKILAGRDFIGGITPRLGDKHIKVVAITGYPKISQPGMIAALDTLSIEFRWNTRAIILDPEHSRSLLDKERRKWRGKIRSFRDQILRTQSGAINHDALEMAQQAEQAMGVASAGNVYFCLYSCNVVLMNDSLEKVEQDANAVAKLIKTLGFECFVETINAIEAWRGTLPGDGYRNVRRVVLHTLNMADMLPTTSVYAGETENPSPLMPAHAPPLFHAATSGATPFRFNAHVGDLGHMLNIGPTGAGKSTLLGLKVAQWFRYPRAQVFAFDKGYSLQTLAMACGGDFYDIGGEEGGDAHGIGAGFAPLENIDTDADIAWATDYVADLCTLSNGTDDSHNPITAKHKKAITEALRTLAQSTRKGEGQRSLTNFAGTVQDEDVRNGVYPYTLGGPYGIFLDAERDHLVDSRFMVFEMEHLMALQKKAVIPVLLYLFRRIELRLDGSPTLIPLDESWVMLDNPLFKARIREWLKTFRRKNAVVDLYTQGVTDISRSSIKDALIESCPTKIYLPNAEAKTPNIRAVYEDMGFNSKELELISTATPKRHYYITSPMGNQRGRRAGWPDTRTSTAGVRDQGRRGRWEQTTRRPGPGCVRGPRHRSSCRHESARTLGPRSRRGRRRSAGFDPLLLARARHARQLSHQRCCCWRRGTGPGGSIPALGAGPGASPASTPQPNHAAGATPAATGFESVGSMTSEAWSAGHSTPAPAPTPAPSPSAVPQAENVPGIKDDYERMDAANRRNKLLLHQGNPSERLGVRPPTPPETR